jgi:hypothetical protein
MSTGGGKTTIFDPIFWVAMGLAAGWFLGMFTVLGGIYVG